ncbi:MAG: hypothetical protein JWO38_5063 [Gemmataceae bacterium]|nr:hypothetical protein [Gemmataceae bacterium]
MTGSDNAPASRPVEPGPAAGQTTITELVSGIIHDAQKLARQQIEMLKSEFKEDLHRTKRATEFGGLGVVLLTIGGLTLVAFLVELLHEQAGFKMWSSCLIIGAILFAAGVALAMTARNLFESFSPLPDKTFNALQENLTWKTEPQT